MGRLRSEIKENLALKRSGQSYREPTGFRDEHNELNGEFAALVGRLQMQSSADTHLNVLGSVEEVIASQLEWMNKRILLIGRRSLIDKHPQINDRAIKKCSSVGIPII